MAELEALVLVVEVVVLVQLVEIHLLDRVELVEPV